MQNGSTNTGLMTALRTRSLVGALLALSACGGTHDRAPTPEASERPIDAGAQPDGDAADAALDAGLDAAADAQLDAESDAALPPCADKIEIVYSYEIRDGVLTCSVDARDKSWHEELTRDEAGDPVCELDTPIGVVVLSNTRPALVEVRCEKP